LHQKGKFLQMKKKTLHFISIGVSIIFTLFLLIFQCFTLAEDKMLPESQAEFRLLRLHYSSSSGEKGVTTFEYDGRGLAYKALWQLLDGSRNSINLYTFDSRGNVIKKYREFSDNITSTQIFEYNDQGKLVLEKFDRSDGVTGTTYYHYDAAGKRIMADCRGLNGWFFGIIKYSYDKNSRKITADIKDKEKKIGTIQYAYDDQNNLAEEFWDLSGKFDQTFTYEYDAYVDKRKQPYTSSNAFININTGYKIVQEEYNYSNQSSGPSFYKYDGDKLAEKVFTRSDGLQTVTHCFYDGDNKLIKSLRIYSPKKSAIFTYSYNKQRQLTARENLQTDGTSMQENYRYDDQGRLMQADWINFDNWLTGTITFIHNQQGNVKQGRFTNTGEKKFSADISFRYDKNQNLSSILWDFSYPATQTYKFKYAKIEQEPVFPVLTGPYFGKTAPKKYAEIFLDGIISTLDESEMNAAFTPDGKEFYYCSRFKGNWAIFVVRESNGAWLKPTPINFTGDFTDRDLTISPDGNKIFFGSNRPRKKGGRTMPALDIFWTERLNSKQWSEPTNIGPPINTAASENYPAVARNGNLYFFSSRKDGIGGCDLYVSPLVNQQYQIPKNLGPAVNSEKHDWDAIIAPDESFIIFSSQNRTDSIGGQDLYISYRKKDRTWTKAKNMGRRVNSEYGEICPSLSLDGKYLFFTSRRRGEADILWIDAGIIAELKPNNQM